MEEGCDFVSMDMQDEEIKEKNRKMEYAEQCLTTLNLELKVSFLDNYIVAQTVYVIYEVKLVCTCMKAYVSDKCFAGC